MRKNCINHGITIFRIKLYQTNRINISWLRLYQGSGVYLRATLIRINTATVNSIRRNATMPSDMETLGDRVLADSTCLQVPIYYGLLSENFNTSSRRSKRLKMVDQEIFGAARQSIWQKSGSTTVPQIPNRVFTLSWVKSQERWGETWKMTLDDVETGVNRHFPFAE